MIKSLDQKLEIVEHKFKLNQIKQHSSHPLNSILHFKALLGIKLNPFKL